MKLKLVVALLASTLIPAWAHAQNFNSSYNFVAKGTQGPGTSFANTGVTAFAIAWTPTSTVASCAVQVDSSADNVTWGSGDLIASQNCAVAGSAAYATLASGKNFVRVNVTSIVGNGGLNVTLTGSSGSSGSSSPGVFTNTQFNGPYLSMLVNGLVPSAQYTSIGQPGVFTDAVDCGMATPASANVHQSDCFAAYITNGSTTTNAVGAYFQAQATANGVSIWGENPLCADMGFSNVNCWGTESDINATGADSAGPTAVTGGTNVHDGMQIVSGGTKRPRAGLYITNGVNANNFFRAGLVIQPNNDTSASNSLIYLVPQDNLDTTIGLHYRNHADSADFMSITNSGAIQTVSAFRTLAGGYVQLIENATSGFGSVAGSCLVSPDSTTHTLMANCNAGTNYHPLRTAEIGTCTMAAGTCTVTWGRAFNATPVVSGTWNGTGTFTTGASLKCTATTTNSVCTSSTGTDTAVIMVVGVGNPN